MVSLEHNLKNSRELIDPWHQQDRTGSERDVDRMMEFNGSIQLHEDSQVAQNKCIKLKTFLILLHEIVYISFFPSSCCESIY